MNKCLMKCYMHCGLRTTSLSLFMPFHSPLTGMSRTCYQIGGGTSSHALCALLPLSTAVSVPASTFQFIFALLLLELINSELSLVSRMQINSEFNGISKCLLQYYHLSACFLVAAGSVVLKPACRVSCEAHRSSCVRLTVLVNDCSRIPLQLPSAELLGCSSAGHRLPTSCG